VGYARLSARARLLCVAAGLVGFIGAWQLSVASGLASDLLLPPPTAVAATLVSFGESTRFWIDLAGTTCTWLAGVVIGTVLGGVLGLVVSFNAYVWAAVEPWIEFLRSLPSVVLVPIISIFLGVGLGSRLACATLVVFVLMVSSAGSAVRSTRASHLRLAVAWRATPWQRLTYFYFPATVSYLAIALRAAIPIALIVTVAAEMLVETDAGLGRILMESYAVFDMRKLYAGVIVVGLLGYISAAVGSLIERRTIHWSEA
jgi:ABC-type nitrate/sulfonate/bicarbonate transport system permease component